MKACGHLPFATVANYLLKQQMKTQCGAHQIFVEHTMKKHIIVINEPCSIGIFDDEIGRVGYGPRRAKATIELAGCGCRSTFLTHL